MDSAIKSILDAIGKEVTSGMPTEDESHEEYQISKVKPLEIKHVFDQMSIKRELLKPHQHRFFAVNSQLDK